MIQSTQTPRQKLKARKCKICGKQYAPGRPHQKYHDDRCRKIAYQQRERERIRAELLAEIKGSQPSHDNGGEIKPK